MMISLAQPAASGETQKANEERGESTGLYHTPLSADHIRR
jgi:hypothetical protein